MIEILFILLINVLLLLIIFRVNPYVYIRNAIKPFDILSSGQELYSLVSLFNPVLVSFGTTQEFSIKENYKFYSELFMDLYEINRKYGAKIHAPWKSLRRSLQKDLSFEKKLKSMTAQALGQMLVMSLFLIIFAASFSIILETWLPRFVWVTLLCLLVLGWVSYLGIYQRMKIGHWKISAQLLKVLVFIEAMAATGLSNTEIIRKSEVSKLNPLSDKEFSRLITQLHQIVDAWQKNGNPIKEVLVELEAEFWVIMELKLEVMTKKLQALQLVCTFLFILPAFFFLVLNTFLSFSGFLIE
jgi:hypothetical protein